MAHNCTFCLMEGWCIITKTHFRKAGRKRRRASSEAGEPLGGWAVGSWLRGGCTYSTLACNMERACKPHKGQGAEVRLRWQFCLKRPTHLWRALRCSLACPAPLCQRKVCGPTSHCGPASLRWRLKLPFPLHLVIRISCTPHSSGPRPSPMGLSPRTASITLRKQSARSAPGPC